jgi:hypothetical protein
MSNNSCIFHTIYKADDDTYGLIVVHFIFVNLCDNCMRSYCFQCAGRYILVSSSLSLQPVWLDAIELEYAGPTDAVI